MSDEREISPITLDEVVLARLRDDRRVPAWLVSAVEILASHRHTLLVTESAAAEPPVFRYSH